MRPDVETRVAAIAGEVRDSLFASVERLGETAGLTARLVSLFEWDFDFAADSLPGDRFRFLVEKRYVGDELLGYGDILVAQYASAGRPVLTSVAFEEAGGRADYFDASGRSVKKMFLRAPLDFTRVTSGFSHARHHPILGGLRPHLAVDYGAPVGTPVRAVADGVVTMAGWDGGFGLSISLRHARGYETMYNHLSRLDVKRGERVRQRQIIGRVGTTGALHRTPPRLPRAQGRRLRESARREVHPGRPGSRPPAGRLHGSREGAARAPRRPGPLPAARLRPTLIPGPLALPPR